MDTVEAYRDLSVHARVNKTGVLKETDAEVQTLAERMTAADPISDLSKWMQARADAAGPDGGWAAEIMLITRP